MALASNRDDDGSSVFSAGRSNQDRISNGGGSGGWGMIHMLGHGQVCRHYRNRSDISVGGNATASEIIGGGGNMYSNHGKSNNSEFLY